MGSSNIICFSQSDDIKMELAEVQKHGYCLWSKATTYCVKRQSIVLDDSDDDTYEPPKRKKSVLVERIKIANALLEEHGSILQNLMDKSSPHSLYSALLNMHPFIKFQFFSISPK